LHCLHFLLLGALALINYRQINKSAIIIISMCTIYSQLFGELAAKAP